jgi:nucleoside diphosphate kinase
VPAVAIAAGSSYDTPASTGQRCGKTFNPTAESEAGTKGLWQITHGYDPDPEKQAVAVYKIYTSNNPDYGCLSSWCKYADCGEAHSAIGQDDKVAEHHRFCRGVWTADPFWYAERVDEIGGMGAITAACSAAAQAKGVGVVANGGRASSSDEEEQMTNFLKKQIGTIFMGETAETMASKLIEAMVLKGVKSLKEASKVIGHGDISKVQEICDMARVQLDPALLQEWFSGEQEQAAEKQTPAQAAQEKAAADADEAKLTEFLNQKIGTIYSPSIAETMTDKIVTAMVSQGIKSLSLAAQRIGQGPMSRAEEVCVLARLDVEWGESLEPQLLREWLADADSS